jgi:tetratricopeptide (TPR) repeat protein
MGGNPDAETAVADTMAATPAASGDASTVAPGLPSTPAELALVDQNAYAVGRELARGGMGRIFEAFDRRHGRPVAIKMLLREDDGAFARFVREATITSRLQHPAIVPVYEAGRWPTGEPFFAMKLVEGRSLDRAIAQAPDLAARLALLPKLIAVTEALAYAHGHGVIHRDLKPLNVLCGDYGETVVIDWGLAKHVAAGETTAPDMTASSDDGLTVAGAAMGTPRYMSPEQARGATVDEKSDVYALGAMLYHLIDGRPPYEGTTGAAMDRVLEGPPPPLATRVPDAPPDLCTIVAKAMSRAPADRYATAAELAAELRRFAAGQLVTAHDYSMTALARRFVSRNRAAVAVAGVLLAVLAATSYIAVKGIMRERNKAQAERAVAQAERNKAQAERAAAEELVDFIQSDLNERLAALGRLDLMRDVGTRVDSYYQATGANDFDAKARRASALSLVGDVAVTSDEPERAKKAYDEALALDQEIARGRPADPVAQRRLSTAYLNVAKGKTDRNDLPGAIADFEQALAVARSAVTLAPADDKNQLAVVDALSELAIAVGHTGKPDDAKKMFDEALTLARKVVADHPEYKPRIALILEVTGGTERERGNYDAGRIAVEEALAIRREVVAELPGDTRQRAFLARAYKLLAGVYVDKQDWKLALANFREERAILEQLLLVEPDNTRWQFLLADNHLDTGDLLRQDDDPTGAEREYTAGLAIAERRARKLPDDGQAQFTLANMHSALGDLLSEKRDRGAVVHYQMAQSIVDALVAKSPSNMRWRYASARTRGGAGNGYFELGDYPSGRAEIDKAIDELDRMLAIAPDVAVYLNLRAELAILHTRAWHDDPKSDEAQLKASARRALAAIDALRAKAPVPQRVLDIEPLIKRFAN